ncbi:unnamed protein product [Linum trigynum]|uniref:Uncharacterized protein n=1 Tax=Linum trigynum TaxID=586398 RepID=A0AAV2DLR5_9ROSI
MAEIDSFRNTVLSARRASKPSLEKSKALAAALHKTGGKKSGSHWTELISFGRCSEAFPSSEMHICGDCADHVDPAEAVLKVHGSNQELQKSWVSADPSSDLYAYLS